MAEDRGAGPWEVIGELCEGDTKHTTFDSQPTFVLTLDAEADRFVYLGDRWNPDDLGDSRHLWLPLQWRSDRPVLRLPEPMEPPHA